MDPDANLTEQRELARDILRVVDSDESMTPRSRLDFISKAGRLADLVQSLDTWLTSGGFLPKGWTR